jgi:hypothetical protein
MNEPANLPQRSQAVQVETWPIERLIPYARNPSKNDGAVDRMCSSSIRQFGCKIPVLARSDSEISMDICA